MRRLLPRTWTDWVALAAVILFASPMIYARPATPWDSLLGVTQAYLIAMVIGFASFVLYGVINGFRDCRKSRMLAEDKALRRLRPADREQP